MSKITIDVFHCIMRFMNNVPFFDNIVISQKVWSGVVEKAEPSDLSDEKSALFGIKVIVSKWMPDDTMLLRQGETIVGIVKPDKDLVKLDEFYAQKLAELVKNRPNFFA